MIFIRTIFITGVLGFFLNNFYNISAQTNITPSTFGQQTYPNSGSTRSRSDVMGGASSASQASNTQERNPEKDSLKDRQEEETNEEEDIKIGPYNKKGKFTH